MNVVLMKFILKMAARNMVVHKVRTALTVLAITWSVATLVALRTLGVGMTAVVNEEVSEFLQADLLIAEDSLVIPFQVVETIRRIPHVVDAVGAIMIPAKVGRYKGVYLVAIPASKLSFFELKLARGSKFSGDQAREVIIDRDTLESLGLKGPGAEVTISIEFGALRMEEEFEIIDVILKKTFISGILGTSFAAAPLGAVQEMLEREGFINYIFVKLDDKKLIDEVADDIKSIFPEADIVKQTDIVRTITRVMDTVRGMLMTVTLVGLLVAALGVMNTVMMSVRERVREIGILKAIGAKDQYIFMVFLSEVLILGVAGGLTGMLLGYAGAFLLRDLVNRFGIAFEIPVHPVPEAFAWGFSVSVAVSVLAAFYPVLKAVKLRPIEALRLE